MQSALTVLPRSYGYFSAASIQLRSPQLRQSIGSLVSALRNGNFDAITANFGLDPAAGAAKLAFGDGTLTLPCETQFCSDLTRIFGRFCCMKLGVGALLAAIQAWADQQSTAESSSITNDHQSAADK